MFPGRQVEGPHQVVVLAPGRRADIHVSVAFTQGDVFQDIADGKVSAENAAAQMIVIQAAGHKIVRDIVRPPVGHGDHGKRLFTEHVIKGFERLTLGNVHIHRVGGADAGYVGRDIGQHKLLVRFLVDERHPEGIVARRMQGQQIAFAHTDGGVFGYNVVQNAGAFAVEHGIATAQGGREGIELIAWNQ